MTLATVKVLPESGNAQQRLVAVSRDKRARQFLDGLALIPAWLVT